MKLLAYVSSMFDVSEMQEIKTDEVLSVLADPTVRKHWLYSVLEEMRDINRRTHLALLDGKLNERFIQESARLQGLAWALRQALNSKTSMELDRRHNPDRESPAGGI